jgi:hypothetical protein
MPQDSSPPRKARRLSRFKRSEATRLLQGTLDAKLPVRGIEVDSVTGDLRVLVGKPDEPNNSGNPWDEGLNAEDAKRAS